jgi:hypothetical protein
MTSIAAAVSYHPIRLGTWVLCTDLVLVLLLHRTLIFDLGQSLIICALITVITRQSSHGPAV